MNVSAVFDGPGAIRLAESDRVGPAPGEVVIEVAACGICGTDRSIFRGEYAVDSPVVLGHEYAGTVIEVGEGVDTFAAGDRVCVDPNITCGSCPYCRRGLTHLCSALRPLGISRDGGFARFSHLPARYAYRLPNHVPFEEGALFEGSCCMNQPKAEEVKAAKASENRAPAANAQAKTVAAKPAQTPAAQAPPPNAGAAKAAATSNASDAAG